VIDPPVACAEVVPRASEWARTWSGLYDGRGNVISVAGQRHAWPLCKRSSCTHARYVNAYAPHTHTHTICTNLAHTYTHLSHTWITTLAIAEPTTAVSSGLDAASAASSFIGGGVVAGPSSMGGGGSAWSLMIDGPGATAIERALDGKCWPVRKTVVAASCCMWWCEEKCRVLVRADPLPLCARSKLA
jgi:hypothetical protein